MAENGELQRTDYLAAVSGGSYIAAGMAMVADTRAGGSDPQLVDETHPPFYRGSPEEQYLRNRSSYLAPGMSGKLSLIYRVTLGLIFHLIFLSLVLAPLGFALGLIYRETFPGLRTRVAEGGWICLSEADNCDFATRDMAWLQNAIAAMVCLAVVAGLVSITVRFSSDNVRTAVQTWSLRALVVPLLLSLMIIWLPAILALLRNLEDEMGAGGAETAQLTTVASAGGTSLATVLLGILLHLRSRVEGPQAVLQDSGVLRQLYTRFARQLRIGFTYLAGAVAGTGAAAGHRHRRGSRDRAGACHPALALVGRGVGLGLSGSSTSEPT
jgi:hypothetical protein